MTHITIVSTIIFILSAGSLYATDSIWDKDAALPGNQKCGSILERDYCFSDGNRSNIYKLPPASLKTTIEKGAEHVLDYPIEITQMQLPKAAMDKFFDSNSSSALRRFIFSIAKSLSNFKSFRDVFTWLGLHDYPKTKKEEGPNFIPELEHLKEYPMGVSKISNNGHIGLTFSCAACHSANLFGTKVMGMTNRFTRANEVFIKGQDILSKTPTFMFNLLVGPTSEDLQTFKKSKEAMNYVGLKQPLALGLDTSLAQVGLSLAKRGTDTYAQKIKNLKPRANKLNTNPADSKPAVWWNLKYKTKWLSDGSIISGNPIYTNFLWNEIGRGIDLRELEGWLQNNQPAIKDLTAYVFASKAPKFIEFFPGGIDIEKAKLGQKLYNKNCIACHGEYTKAWQSEDSHLLSYAESLETTKVWYHTQTKVKNVNTDSFRRKGMRYFYKDLNRLSISKTIGAVVKPQRGYVPPPLIGIWARWPYFHNNSVPTLYDVISLESERPRKYVSVPALDRDIDYDRAKLGYPIISKIRKPYRNNMEHLFDTSIPGLSNKGHNEVLLDFEGKPLYNEKEKYQLLEYLKTL
jgi:hypothetical protein